MRRLCRGKLPLMTKNKLSALFGFLFIFSLTIASVFLLPGPALAANGAVCAQPEDTDEPAPQETDPDEDDGSEPETTGDDDDGDAATEVEEDDDENAPEEDEEPEEQEGAGS